MPAFTVLFRGTSGHSLFSPRLCTCFNLKILWHIGVSLILIERKTWTVWGECAPPPPPPRYRPTYTWSTYRFKLCTSTNCVRDLSPFLTQTSWENLGGANDSLWWDICLKNNNRYLSLSGLLLYCSPGQISYFVLAVYPLMLGYFDRYKLLQFFAKM